MAGQNIDDDEYVANLLKQDAQNSTKQYKMVGLDAFLPSRSRTGAPKPNTRFLRHIIRETDSHNSALLAKETEESRARLRQLTREKELRHRTSGRLTPPNDPDEQQQRRKRKRSRHEERNEDRHAQRRRARSDDDDGREDRSRRNKDRDSAGRREKIRHGYSDSENDLGNRTKHSRVDRDPARRRRRSRSGSRSRSPERKKSHRERGDKRHKHRGSRRSYSRDSDPSPSPPLVETHKSSRPRRGSASRHRSHERGERCRSPRLEAKDQLPDSDSDPLEAIVGPLPPPSAPAVRTRGRGAHKINSMAMDARFSSTYNPSADTHLPSDVEDDWGDALEALKDRQRWKQQGAERLKTAGFSDEQVKRWEKGDEKTEDDVRWALKGEAREWDRGKVLDDEGDVNLKATWGRLI